VCGRFTVKMTWAEIVELYKLTLDRPPHNLQPRFNVCPTDPIDVVTERDGRRDFVRMRWGLVPAWWPKPLKELRAATFNARAETVADKPFFRDAFTRTRCLIPASGYYEWKNTPGGKQPYYFTRADGRADHVRWPLGRMEGSRNRRDVKVMYSHRHRAQCSCRGNTRPHACDS
jgi:putative SOS response-associated peptidase YedK